MPFKSGFATIIGRPNVGKSTFFNRVAGKRQAIVEDLPGVTRDRIYAECSWEGRPFLLVDTGGFDPASDAPLQKQIFRQVEEAIRQLKRVLWEGTENWDTLLIQRAAISGRLVTTPAARAAIRCARPG